MNFSYLSIIYLSDGKEKAPADTRVSFAGTEGNSAEAHYFKRTSYLLNMASVRTGLLGSNSLQLVIAKSFSLGLLWWLIEDAGVSGCWGAAAAYVKRAKAKYWLCSDLKQSLLDYTTFITSLQKSWTDRPPGWWNRLSLEDALSLLPLAVSIFQNLQFPGNHSQGG